MACGSICLIGNLNMDLILRGLSTLPDWGQEVVGGGYVLAASGQAGYCAFALGALGERVAVIGTVGDDAYGRQILSALEARGVDTRGVETVPGSPTGLTVALVRKDGERAFVSDYGCLSSFTEVVARRHWQLVEKADVVCFFGLCFLPAFALEAAAELLGRAKSLGKETVLDTGWDPAGWPQAALRGLRRVLEQVTVFLPNLDEARAISGRPEAWEAARSLQELGPETVVVKLGAQGCLAVEGARRAELPALSVPVYDAVGAGDVFNAGFLYGRRRGWALEACLAFASAASALYISRPGDRFPAAAEVFAAARPYGLVAQESV